MFDNGQQLILMKLFTLISWVFCRGKNQPNLCNIRAGSPNDRCSKPLMIVKKFVPLELVNKMLEIRSLVRDMNHWEGKNHSEGQVVSHLTQGYSNKTKICWLGCWVGWSNLAGLQTIEAVRLSSCRIISEFDSRGDKHGNFQSDRCFCMRI